MSIFKRGRIYWYKFTFNGKAIRESTRQTNQHTARDMESAHRSSLAKGEVGIRDKKQSLTLAQFCDERFEPGRSQRSRKAHRRRGWTSTALACEQPETTNRWQA
jgi:hypothetical protein